MEIEVKIDESCASPKVVIHTNKITAEINELVKKLSEKQPFNLIGYKNENLEILQLDEIVRIYAEQQKVYAKTDKDIYKLKLRLYEVKNKLCSSNFIRISNSEIVIFIKIRNLNISYNGTICIIFKWGDKFYVSRRYVMKIKKFLGI